MGICYNYSCSDFGELVELVDTTGSGSVASRRESSNLLFPTINDKQRLSYFDKKVFCILK